MCGRFRVARSKELLEEAFGAEADFAVEDDAGAEVADSGARWGASYAPRYNAAPGQKILVVRQDAARQNSAQPVRKLSPLRWGLLPAWAKDESLGYKMINARAETAAAKPAFREAMRRRRCLIPADGFYEWRRDGKRRIPYCFTLADGRLFAFAGLWEQWRGSQGKTVESCTILTSESNELVSEIHDRMPVILAPENYDLWLDPGFARPEALEPMLQPYPAARMRRYRVGERVNSVQYDDPECAAEIPAA
jgi:putative SOS response-associated peptidase YedK